MSERKGKGEGEGLKYKKEEEQEPSHFFRKSPLDRKVGEKRRVKARKEGIHLH